MCGGKLLRVPGVKTADTAPDAQNVEITWSPFPQWKSKWNSTNPGDRLEEILADIRETMKGIPGTFSALSAPLADRVGHMLSGVSAKVAVKIFGPDLDELQALGDEVTAMAREIPGLEEARTEQQAPVPQLRIEPDRERAAAYAVTPGSLTEEMSGLMGGEYVAEIYEGVKVYDMVVRLPGEWRENPGTPRIALHRYENRQARASRHRREYSQGHRPEQYPAGKFAPPVRGFDQPDCSRSCLGSR